MAGHTLACVSLESKTMTLPNDKPLGTGRVQRPSTDAWLRGREHSS